jgi:hypothetical protein
MTTQFVYIDQVVNEDFSLFNEWKENGERKVLEFRRNLYDRDMEEERTKEVPNKLKELNLLADQAKFSTLLSQVIFVAICQIALTCIVIRDIFKQKATMEYPYSFEFAFSKFICGLLLHWECQARIRQGIDGMKFALNHKHRFDRPYLAFSVSFTLMLIMVFIEFGNFSLILQTSDLGNLIQNVFSLVIIAEADKLFEAVLKDEVLSKIMSLE